MLKETKQTLSSCSRPYNTLSDWISVNQYIKKFDWGGGAVKEKSPDSRSPEVGISASVIVLCVLNLIYITLSL